MFRRRDMFGQSLKWQSRPPKNGLCPHPGHGGKWPGSSDQVFQIAVISEYYMCPSLTEIRSVTSEITRRKEKKKKKERKKKKNKNKKKE